MRLWVKMGLQVMVLFFLSRMGNIISKACHCTMIPGSLVGLVILWTLLQLKAIPFEWLSSGGEWLVSNLLLFFVPQFLAVVQYGRVITMDGLRLAGVIAASTTLVMACTGLMEEALSRRKVEGNRE